MASHKITVWTLLSLVAIVTGQCPDETPLSVKEAFEKADNVFLGHDVTDLAGCQANDGSCSRRQIQFQVQCVLKQTQDLDAWSFGVPVSIGENRTIRACDRTFFGYGAPLKMIIMVTRKTDASGRAYLDWDETNNATRAHFVYGPDLERSFRLTCDVKDPFDQDKDSCTVDQSQCCSNRCAFDTADEPGSEDRPDAGDMRVWLSAKADRHIGVHCCKKLRAGKINRWITDDNDNTQVVAYGLNPEPLPVVHISRTAYDKATKDERLAVVMSTRMIVNSTVRFQVWWMVANLTGSRLSDGFVKLNTDQGSTLVDYMPPLPGSRKGLMVYLEVYKHRLVSSVNISAYESDVCAKTEQSALERCLFDLDRAMEPTDLNMQSLGQVRVNVIPDDWSVMTAIRNYDVSPLSVCPLINSKVVPYKNTILCPAPTSTDSLGVTTASSNVLMILVSAALLFLK